ncbi:MAG: hypothetical protein CM1200mP15_05800 [Dehalococcoidia bacterium]|nr:MAG: hypothetical protein CM1200mP15_05800 [Dehalococcoidia bacterium]
MDANLTLSVVDQSPMREGGNSGDALRETIELAVAVERMGYSRYWVAEHHNLPNFAGTSPEMLIGQIAARTQTIRVGSGGVMLSHYSALKVAENFRFLDSLYPDRIDLGIGRAPGSDQLTMSALAYPAYPKGIEHFPRQVSDVVGYLSGSLQDGHPFADVSLPRGKRPPYHRSGCWVQDTRVLIWRPNGIVICLCPFFWYRTQDGPDIVEGYRKNFQPSEYLAKPQVNVGVHVVCADTEEEALNMPSRNLARLFSVTGRAKGIPVWKTLEITNI